MRFVPRCHTRVEAGSNTSTVTLRVVWGDEKGSLKSETVIYGHESQGTRTRERLRWRGPAAYIKDPPSRQRGCPTKQDRNCQTVINIWSWAPGLDTKTYWLTDRQSQCDFDFDLCKIGILCPTKPVLTEDLCVVQKQHFLSLFIFYLFFNNMLYVRNVHLTKGQVYQ
jgi:hypothetical protein